MSICRVRAVSFQGCGWYGSHVFDGFRPMFETMKSGLCTLMFCMDSSNPNKKKEVTCWFVEVSGGNQVSIWSLRPLIFTVLWMVNQSKKCYAPNILPKQTACWLMVRNWTSLVLVGWVNPWKILWKVPHQWELHHPPWLLYHFSNYSWNSMFAFCLLLFFCLEEACARDPETKNSQFAPWKWLLWETIRVFLLGKLGLGANCKLAVRSVSFRVPGPISIHKTTKLDKQTV